MPVFHTRFARAFLVCGRFPNLQPQILPMTPSLGLATYRWNNNIKSMLLLAAFPFLLMALVGGFFAVAAWVYQNGTPNGIDAGFFQGFGLPADTPRTVWAAAQAALWAYWPLVVGMATLWVLIGYFFNDAMIRAATGAKAVTRSEAPELYKLLENLCILRGLAMPRLYVIDSDALNAFATGLDEKSYSVTVTRGLLAALDRDELEAVLAHELSHIINRDCRLLVVTVVFTGMISFIAQMAWRSLRFSSYGRNRNRNNGGVAGLALIAAVLASIGYVLALVLRFALSRKREYLADAGAVALTKNPDALIEALRKISGRSEVPHVPAEVRQMFIENPPSLFGLFDTHPPIEQRIAVLRQLGGLPPEGESIIPPSGGNR